VLCTINIIWRIRSLRFENTLVRQCGAFNEGRVQRRAKDVCLGTLRDSFLPKSSDSLPTAPGVALFSAVLRPRFLLRLAPARATASGIVRSSARGQLDKLHTKRPTQDLLGLIKHGLKCAALRAYNFFRDLVAAEGHAPLFIKEREPN